MQVTLRPKWLMAAFVAVLAAAALTAGGCKTVTDVDRTDKGEFAGQGRFVFVRPDRYTVLGTRSVRDYLEVTYEKLSTNAAGQPVVSFGLRNRGGQHWWDGRGPRVTIAAKAVFYSEPVAGGAIESPPVFESNWQRIPMTRGETIHYTFVSPVAAEGYQVTLSDAY